MNLCHKHKDSFETSQCKIKRKISCFLTLSLFLPDLKLNNWQLNSQTPSTVMNNISPTYSIIFDKVIV